MSTIPRSPTSTPSPRPCWRCPKCQALQSRIQAVGNEYDSLRPYLLRDTKQDNNTSEQQHQQQQKQQGDGGGGGGGGGGSDVYGDDLREQIAQLKITIDTLVRSQLFEILDS